MPNARMPRSVLVASDALYLQLASDPDTIGLLQRVDAMVVPYAANPLFNESRVLRVREHLDLRSQLTEGSILIKNPFDLDSFEIAENAIAAFTADKYRVMAKLAALLGAVEVTLGEARVESERAEWSGDLKSRFKIGSGASSAKREVRGQVTSRISAHLTFPGGSPSLEQAREHLDRHNLSRDNELNALVQLREGPYPVIRFEMKMSGTKELESSLRCALDLANAGPVKLLQIGGSFTKTANVIKDIEITTTIDFPTPE